MIRKLVCLAHPEYKLESLNMTLKYMDVLEISNADLTEELHKLIKAGVFSNTNMKVTRKYVNPNVKYIVTGVKPSTSKFEKVQSIELDVELVSEMGIDISLDETDTSLVSLVSDEKDKPTKKRKKKK